MERALLAAIVERLAVITKQPMWPEFRPATMPLAVAMCDAGSTWRVSWPPASILPPDATMEVVAGQPAIRFPEIDSRIVANSVADSDGVPTATVIVPPGAMAADAGSGWNRYVGIAAHELFHVHQAERGFAPGGNEAALLTFPWDDPASLALARAEWSALRRAVDAQEAADAQSAAQDALALRRERIARLSEEELAYVRATELKEGTARYVEARTLWDEPPNNAFRMDEAGLELRYRCYDTGLAWCLLLDRVDPDDWKVALLTRSDGAVHLDEIVMAALSDRGDGGKDPGSWLDFVPAATDDIARERTSRSRLLASLRSPRRARAVVRAAPGLELLVAGFDPLNVLAIDATTVVHERYLELTAGDATMTVLDRSAITTSKGDHPLFAGLLETEVVGEVGPAPISSSFGLGIEGSHEITEGNDAGVVIVLGAPAS